MDTQILSICLAALAVLLGTISITRAIMAEKEFDRQEKRRKLREEHEERLRKLFENSNYKGGNSNSPSNKPDDLGPPD